jgi:hypothetical protein
VNAFSPDGTPLWPSLQKFAPVAQAHSALLIFPMLALFRNNEFFTVPLLAAYIALVRLPALVGWMTAPSEAAAAGWLYLQLVPSEMSPSISALLATALVIFQAIAVDRLFNKYRMSGSRTWLVGMLYGLAASCVPDFLFLSPALVATTLLPIGLWRIFSVYRQPLAFSTIFDSAFWFFVAALFYPPSVWFLVGGFLGISSLRSFSFREQMVYIAGVLSPLVILLTALYWFDQTAAFWRIQTAHLFAWPYLMLPEQIDLRLAIGLLSLLLLIAGLGFNIYYHRKNIQVKKYIDILYGFFIIGLLAAFFRPGSTLDGFLLVMPTVGIFLSYLFQSSRNHPLTELLHLLAVGAVITVQLISGGIVGS